MNTTVEAVRELERAPAPLSSVGTPDCFGWGAYDLDVFARLLDVAIGAAPARTFLDAGCGIGTKCLLAASRGLDAYGIDRVPAYAARAVQLGVNAEVADVRGWDRYGEFGIVYVSHPLKAHAEAPFEAWLHGQMAPGAVLVTLRGCVAPAGWQPLVHESYRRTHSEPPRFRGVYVKPGRVGQRAVTPARPSEQSGSNAPLQDNS